MPSLASSEDNIIRPVLKIEAETTLNRSYPYFHRKVRERKAHGRLLQKAIFAPLTPPFWGEPEFSRPSELGDLAGIPGFMQELY